MCNLDFNKGFINNNNYHLLKLDKDKCKLEGIITDSSLNPFNIAHGGYIFGLADTCAGMLANYENKAVTTSASINYLKPAKGNRLLATAKIVRKGKHLITCECEIYDNKKELVAKATMEYFIIND